MDGFRLSVTNDPSDVAISEVCYKDKKDGSARITQTVDCYKMGKVLLYDKYTSDNNNGYPFIELCYVGINGKAWEQTHRVMLLNLVLKA